MSEKYTDIFRKIGTLIYKRLKCSLLRFKKKFAIVEYHVLFRVSVEVLFG